MTVKASSSLPSAKRRKIKRTDASDELESVIILEKQIQQALVDNASLNALLDLLHIALSSKSSEIILKAVFALYRIFTQVIAKGLLQPDSDGDLDAASVRTWLLSRLDSFTTLLCGLLKDEEKTLRASSLKILFSLLRQQSKEVAASKQSASTLPFDEDLFRKIVEAVSICSKFKRNNASNSTDILESDIRDQLLGNWLNVHTDIKFFYLRDTCALLADPRQLKSYPSLVPNVLSILENFTLVQADSFAQSFWVEELANNPTSTSTSSNMGLALSEKDPEDDWRAFFDEPAADQTEPSTSARKSRRIHNMNMLEQVHSPQAHRILFTRCWLTLLPLLQDRGAMSGGEHDEQKDLELVTRALSVLHRVVMPHLTRTILIMDWVAGCVDYGGNVGMLALNALFALMQDYNLDYPQFYTKLYAFLDRNALHHKYRARFFRLFETFLLSTHLPSSLLASFVKRLSRLSLSAPPAAIIMVIPFVYNILKRHPTLMVMIHRTEPANEDEDPFNANEPNPLYTGALQSSLWELYTHKSHYHTTVQTMTKVFEEAFTKPSYSMEDFLDHTYATLFDTEAKRKLKKEPIVVQPEIAVPMGIRRSSDADADLVGSADVSDGYSHALSELEFQVKISLSADTI